MIFLPNVSSSWTLTVGLALADPYLAACAALGSMSATYTSRAVLALDVDDAKNVTNAINPERSAWEQGLWGYNGALVGCAFSVFGPTFAPAAVLSTVVGAAATTAVSASLKNVTSMPQWTWSFNAVALTSLLRTQPLLDKGSIADANSSAAIVSAGTDVNTDAAIDAANVAVEASTSAITAAAETAITATDLLLSPLVGLSQIFVVDSQLTGLFILAAIGMHSPKMAVRALGGSAIGCIAGYTCFGADPVHVASGLWGYNSALVSMAVSAFFVNNARADVLGGAGAFGTAGLFGAMQVAMGASGIAGLGVPCLTLPFCVGASLCYTLPGVIPGLILAEAPHSPEKNEAKKCG